jgi:hypothetical protein
MQYEKRTYQADNLNSRGIGRTPPVAAAMTLFHERVGKKDEKSGRSDENESDHQPLGSSRWFGGIRLNVAQSKQ